MTKEFKQAITWRPTIGLRVVEEMTGINGYECEFMQGQANDSYICLGITDDVIEDLRGDLEYTSDAYNRRRIENDIRVRNFLRTQFDDFSIEEVLLWVSW